MSCWDISNTAPAITEYPVLHYGHKVPLVSGCDPLKGATSLLDQVGVD